MRGLGPVVRPDDEFHDCRPGGRGDEEIIGRQERERRQRQPDGALPRRDQGRNDDRPDPREREQIDEDVGGFPRQRGDLVRRGERAADRPGLIRSNRAAYSTEKSCAKDELCSRRN